MPGTKSNETILKSKASAKAMWAEPQIRANITEGIRRASKDPDNRKRISDKAKARWARPGFKERATAITGRTISQL